LPRWKEGSSLKACAETEVKRLCDAHALVVRDVLDRQEPVRVDVGHPLDTMKRENEALSSVIASARRAAERLDGLPDDGVPEETRRELATLVERLGEVDKHYLRKECQLFPVLEKHGVVAPPKVMWAVHDDVRMMLKKAREAVRGGALSRPAQAPSRPPALRCDLR